MEFIHFFVIVCYFAFYLNASNWLFVIVNIPDWKLCYTSKAFSWMFAVIVQFLHLVPRSCIT